MQGAVWMDLFGWGTGDKADRHSKNAADYAVYTNWGENAILNSSHDAGTWRAMSADEWDYVLNGRTDAAAKRTLGNIEGSTFFPVNGLILLPDSFEMPEGLQMDMKATNFEVNTYEPTDWLLLEANGAVFIPLGAYRDGDVIKEYDYDNHRASTGYYWTSSASSDTEAKQLTIDASGPALSARSRALGMSVRLVKDAGSTQGIEGIHTNTTPKTAKVLRDGVLYIIRDGKVYTSLGAEVK